MPKIYKYFGIVFHFYSKEHLPIHVHGRKGEFEIKAEIKFSEGKVDAITIKNVAGKKPLSVADKRDFVEFVNKYAFEIRNKWIQFFVDGSVPNFEEINSLN